MEPKTMLHVALFSCFELDVPTGARQGIRTPDPLGVNEML
jgi:hypothetical protein